MQHLYITTANKLWGEFFFRYETLNGKGEMLEDIASV